MPAVPGDANDRDRGHHEDRHGESDDDMAGVGEAARDHAEDIAEQNEHEQSEDEREIAPALLADGAADHVADELVAQLDQRLQAPRHHAGVT